MFNVIFSAVISFLVQSWTPWTPPAITPSSGTEVLEVNNVPGYFPDVIYPYETTTGWYATVVFGTVQHSGSGNPSGVPWSSGFANVGGTGWTSRQVWGPCEDPDLSLQFEEGKVGFIHDIVLNFSITQEGWEELPPAETEEELIRVSRSRKTRTFNQERRYFID